MTGGISPITDTSLMHRSMCDPYFLAALQSPNPNVQVTAASASNLSFQGNTGAQSAATNNVAIDTAATDSSAANAIQTSTNAGEKKKKNPRAKVILGFLALAGTTALCIAAHKKGSADLKGLEKMGDGFKQIWQGCKNKVCGIFGKGTSGKEFSICQIGDETVCTIPNRTNRIISEFEKELAKVGSSTEAPTVLTNIEKTTDGVKETVTQLADNIKLREVTFKEAVKDYTVTCRNGEITKIIDKDGNNIVNQILHPTEQADIDFCKNLKELAEKYTSGEKLSDALSYKYAHTENGVTRMFSNDGKTSTITGAVTNKFNIKTYVAQAYLGRNPEVDKIITEALEKGDLSELKILSAEVENATLGNKFIIKNNKITGFIENGTFYEAGSDHFDAVKKANPTIFENILKNKDVWTNPVYGL